MIGFRFRKNIYDAAKFSYVIIQKATIKMLK